MTRDRVTQTDAGARASGANDLIDEYDDSDWAWDDNPEDDCDHDQSQYDILVGRYTCPRCGLVWYPPKGAR